MRKNERELIIVGTAEEKLTGYKHTYTVCVCVYSISVLNMDEWESVCILAFRVLYTQIRFCSFSVSLLFSLLFIKAFI